MKRAGGAAHMQGMMTLTQVPLKNMDTSQLAAAILVATGQDRLVVRAIGDATFLHRNQTRANRGPLERTPYIEHPLRGALRLIRWGVTDRDTIIAALLHDTVEDTALDILAHRLVMDPAGMSDEEVRSRAAAWITGTYGSTVTSIVMAVTNPFTDKSMSRPARNLQYAAHVRAAIATDPRVFLVKFSDYMDNAAGLYHNNTPRNRGMVTRLAAKYRPVTDVFEESLKASATAVSGYVSDAGLAEITLKIGTSRARLDMLAAV